MNDDIKLLNPRKVWKFFTEINEIPRGSGNEKAVSDYFVNFAKERNLEVYQDQYFNVLIKKPATAGYENSPAVILQGHMDMVCEKISTSNHDFTKDPIKMLVKGDFVTADGTTLGADNGIAAAMGLAILDSSDISHAPLEVLLTTDEESGMNGARNFDMSRLSGRMLINLDSEEEGHILTCCAGGLRATINMPFSKTEAPTDYDYYKLTISGLKGGHSGSDIHLQRANANKLMGRLLNNIIENTDCICEEINGGSMDNAITRDSWAVIGTKDIEKLKEIILNTKSVFENEYKNIENSINIDIEKTAEKAKYVFSAESFKNAVNVLMLIPYGVESMSTSIKGLVESSSNIGVVRTEENSIKFTSAVRSSVETRKHLICDKIKIIASLVGAEYTSKGEYPAWEYKEKSHLRDVLAQTYEKMFWQKPHIDAIHAGLECGLFSGRMSDMDMVSIGPEMADVHTPDERVSISSVERTYSFVIAVLKNLK